MRRAEYDAVYREGRRRSSHELTVFVRPNGLHLSRFGWSIKKALGTAVRRNRIRRRLREILRLHRQEIPPGWDIVIHPRSSVATADFSALTQGAAEAGKSNAGIVSQTGTAGTAGEFSARAGHRRQPGCCSCWFASTSRSFRRFSEAPAGIIPPARTTRPKPSLATVRGAESRSPLRRLIALQSLHKGGFDPVPDELTGEPAVGMPHAQGDAQ